jgi:hypothetical protein
MLPAERTEWKYSVGEMRLCFISAWLLFSGKWEILSRSCRAWAAVMGDVCIPATGAKGLMFTDEYELTINETPASDSTLPTTSPHNADSVTAVCLDDDGSQIPEPVAYSILDGNEQQLFTIDPDSGVFLLAVPDYPFDYENRSLYSVTLHCRLAADASRNGDGSVDVRIGPVNEYWPALRVPPFILLSETTPVGTIIAAPSNGPGATYSASDADDGPDGVITYTISGGDDSFFELDRGTGTITLTVDPDVDDIPTGILALSISIVACNEGTALDLCDTQHVRIFITPVNDLPPGFTKSVYTANLTEFNDNLPQFTKSTYTVNLTESDQNGTSVARCVDEDKGGVGGVLSIVFASGVSNETRLEWNICSCSTSLVCG